MATKTNEEIKTDLEEIEKLYNNLLYFDKQRFICRHLEDARMEDIDDFIDNFG